MKNKNLLEIPDSELEWSFVRSSGPGGQNVNRTNSCAILRWNYLVSTSLQQLSPTSNILEKLKSIATTKGDIFVRSQSFRDQERNKEECRLKLKALMEKVFFEPKKRVATKPTHGSKKRRLNSKKLHSAKKGLRQRKFESE